MAANREGTQKYKAHLPRQLRILAEHGWFIQGDYTPLAAIYPLADMFRVGRVKEANRQMCEHIRSCAKDIEESLIQDYPKRSIILKRAFDALSDGDYVVSVPMMLSQADGIGREIIAPYIKNFSITSTKPQSQQAIQDFISNKGAIGAFTSEIFQAILGVSQLNVSEGHRLRTSDGLNRHAVLHGLDTEYATELNALKSAAWIGYVAYFGAFKEIRKLSQKGKALSPTC